MRPQNLIRVTIAGLLAILTLCAMLVSPPPASALPTWFTPTPRPGHSVSSASQHVAVIELSAVSAPATAWTVVQWLGAANDWHDVDGWQGPFDVAGQIWWSVEPSDFGHGPFRWVVYDKKGGSVWGISALFKLPFEGGQRISITAAKGPPAAAATQWSFTADNPAFSPYAGGCGQYAIAGQVFGIGGQPLNSYRLQLAYPDGDKEIIPSGGAPDYGRSGFGFLLGQRRPNRLYRLQLLAPGAAGQSLSAEVPIVFTGACDQNFAWVVFRQVSP